jgi:hypothetical protein
MDFEKFANGADLVSKLVHGNNLIALIVILALIAIIVHAVKGVLDNVAKALSSLKSGIMQVVDAVRGGADFKEFLQRRKQFLAVLEADLSVIGKAEAWNDQNFTDLEAEVQIEGGYYASRWDRLRGRLSHAERKEKSLIGAIDGSAERCLLLTGDPGAGKSVALRHLATQLVRRAKKSRQRYVPVPLYINLRDLAKEGEVNQEFIRNFVIENVRRGDADTAQYIQDNWVSFNANGGWFFLFDSFDEIPEVLHSANEDASVDKYGRAIQQFMDGLGSCHGVLASREFKSPKTIPWPRLRILPLSERLQEELIGNTFLSKSLKKLSLRTVLTSPSSIYRNPLFITLLCRYVRDNNDYPKNEHELLYRHVESLISRDDEFVEKKWGYSPAGLLVAASELAKLFALAPDMGLSPTIEELKANAKRLKIFGEDVEKAVEALTYVKVGRMDVASAARFERRFAFSHRRYQEAIFARHLSNNLSAFSAKDLFSNPRWREYVVAMLQSNVAEDMAGLIAAASKLFEDLTLAASYTEDRVQGRTVRSYSWGETELTHILRIMVEVKRFNASAAWGVAEKSVEKFFAPLWAKGDLQDRLMIIRYGGAGDAIEHSKRVDSARQSGVAVLQQEAIYSCQFAVAPSPLLAEWIRDRVANGILSAKRDRDTLKWEALASQLPASYEISLCLERAKSLRKQQGSKRAWLFPLEMISRLGRPGNVIDAAERRIENGAKLFMLFVNILPFFLLIGAAFSVESRAVPPLARVSFACLVAIYLINVAIIYIRVANLSSPRKIGVRDVFLSVKEDKKTPLILLGFISLSVAVFLAPGVILIKISKFLQFTLPGSTADIILWSGAAFTAAIALLSGALAYLDHKKDEKAAEVALKSKKTLRSAILGAARSSRIYSLCVAAMRNDDLNPMDVRRSIALISVRLFWGPKANRTIYDDLEYRRSLSLLLEFSVHAAESDGFSASGKKR